MNNEEWSLFLTGVVIGAAMVWIIEGLIRAAFALYDRTKRNL